MSAFDEAMNLVFRWEGGYVHDPDDPGGETNFGISKRAHPEVDIKALTKGKAARIYREDYWKPIRGDSLPRPLAIVLMDFAVHSGGDRALRTLQRVLHVGTTTAALDAATTLSDREALSVARDLVEARGNLFVRLAVRRKGSAKYLVGWMRRLKANIELLEA